MSKKTPPPQEGVILPDGMMPGTPESDAYVKEELAKSKRRQEVSQSPARAARRRASKNGSEPKPVEDQAQPPQPPGAVVFRIDTENAGEVQLQIQEINGLDPFAVPALLRAAANIKEQQLNAGGK